MNRFLCFLIYLCPSVCWSVPLHELARSTRSIESEIDYAKSFLHSSHEHHEKDMLELDEVSPILVHSTPLLGAQEGASEVADAAEEDAQRNAGGFGVASSDEERGRDDRGELRAIETEEPPADENVELAEETVFSEPDVEEEESVQLAEEYSALDPPYAENHPDTVSEEAGSTDANDPEKLPKDFDLGIDYADEYSVDDEDSGVMKLISSLNESPSSELSTSPRPTYNELLGHLIVIVLKHQEMVNLEGLETAATALDRMAIQWKGGEEGSDANGGLVEALALEELRTDAKMKKHELHDLIVSASNLLGDYLLTLSQTKSQADHVRLLLGESDERETGVEVRQEQSVSRHDVDHSK